MDLEQEQSCSSDVDTDEELLEEKQPAPTTPQRIKSFLRKNWRNVLVLVCLWIAFSLCTAAFSLMTPFFPKEAYHKGVSKGIIGLIIGASPLVVVFLSPLLGYVLPLVGISWYILVGLLLVGTSYVLLGFVILIPPTWGFILACILLRVTEGAGTAMFYTATYSTFPNLFPKSVSFLMGVIQTAAGFGFTIGRPLGGLLYHVGGYRLPFLSIGLSIVLFTLPCTLIIMKLPVKVERTMKFLPWRVIFGIITDCFFIVLGLTIVAAYITLGYQGPILQLFLYEKFQLGPVGVSWVFFVLAASYSISNLLAGMVSEKLTSVYVSVFGLVVAAAGLLVMGIQDYIHYWDLWMSYVSVLVTGVGGAFAVVPIYNKMITVSKRYTIICKRDRSELVAFVSGIVSASVCFGQYLGPVLGGVLSDFMSFPITSAILGFTTIAQALLLTGVHLIHEYI